MALAGRVIVVLGGQPRGSIDERAVAEAAVIRRLRRILLMTRIIRLVRGGKSGKSGCRGR